MNLFMKTAGVLLALSVCQVNAQVLEQKYGQDTKKLPRVEALNQTRVWNMGHQKSLIEEKWRRYMGEQIRGDERDIATMQRFIDEQLYDVNDHQQLLGLGFILGDIWVNKHGLVWQTYVDRKGKSTAVCVKDTTACLFAATMISRRLEGNTDVDVKAIYDRATKSMAPLFPETY